jgi:regulator of sirC expression with transglutaminase-like and TPR domain
MIEALALIDDEAIALDEAALALAALDRREPDTAPYAHRIAYIAAQLLVRAPGILTSEARARALRDLIAGEHAITGDDSSFADEAGADLMHVLDRKRGLPVTLSLLYVAIARKVGWSASCIGVPGHVLIRVGDEPGCVHQDPFDDGRVLDQDALRHLLARVLGRGSRPDPAYLAPMSNRATLVRLLTNQAVRARRAGELERALALYERMTAFAPGQPNLWWERARIEQHLERLGAARTSLVAMLETTRDPALVGRITAALRSLARQTG